MKCPSGNLWLLRDYALGWGEGTTLFVSKFLSTTDAVFLYWLARS